MNKKYLIALAGLIPFCLLLLLIWWFFSQYSSTKVTVDSSNALLDIEPDLSESQLVPIDSPPAPLLGTAVNNYEFSLSKRQVDYFLKKKPFHDCKDSTGKGCSESAWGKTDNDNYEASYAKFADRRSTTPHVSYDLSLDAASNVLYIDKTSY